MPETLHVSPFSDVFASSTSTCLHPERPMRVSKDWLKMIFARRICKGDQSILPSASNQGFVFMFL